MAGVFMRTGLSPNALTLIGFGIAVVGAWLASQQSWLIAGIVVAFGAAFDLFDGALARATGKTSRLGAFMDSVFDRAGEAVVYVGLVVGLLSVGLAGGAEITAAAMAAAFMVSYTRAKSESLGFSSGTGMANVGLAPREVRSVILSLALVVAGLLVEPVGAVAPTWWYVLVGSLAVIAILATITTIQRILFVYRQSKSPNQEVTK
ncbi:MAG TPA: CDP-alcohol phosphatidyltransferase family protein [Candidatus Limnocylindrales bacterium]|nr:CDP-alcohol phosphatidyltransferase family protein [Candidatus Limnocylindrales bacterium]